MAQEPVDVNWSSFLYDLLTKLDDLQGAVINFRREQSVRDPRPTRPYGLHREVPLSQAQRDKLNEVEMEIAGAFLVVARADPDTSSRWDADHGRDDEPG